MAGSSSVELLAGSVVNTTPDVAEKWQKQGIAMEDKSMDGGSELKVVDISNVNEKIFLDGVTHKEVKFERKTRNVRRRRIKK